MSKHSFFWKILAFFLFLTGSVLAQIENGSELSLWITAFGAVLALSIQAFQILSIPNFTQLKASLREVFWSALITNDLAIGLSAFAFIGRFFGEAAIFRLCLSAAQALWFISFILVILRNRSKRRATHE
ncbi:MAG: hypothetical protein MUO40_09735 [Anaerolineaceae bacterium]|nr:hypothetical protein [Anaerolineaceae bacterium]